MHPTGRAAVLAALGGILFLAACSQMDNMVDPVSPGPGPDMAPRSFADAQTADPEAARAAGAEAANALPGFGSVTQSSNSASGVTTDTASASLEGSRLTLRVERANGRSLTLDSAGEASQSQDIDFPVEGRSGRAYALLDLGALSLSRTAISVAAVYTSWDDDDPANYLAGGYWMHVEGELLDPDGIAVEIGAFMDGPELSGTPALAALGEASYRGPATGIYAYRYGSGHADRLEGSGVVGEFFGIAALDADFAAGTVSGSIEELTVSGLGAAPDGEAFEIAGEDPGLRVDLGSAAFGRNGTFTGRAVTVASTNPNRTIDSSGGAWGGRFSNVPETDQPRLVGGTVGAEWEERNGGGGVVLGAFLGATGPLAASAAR